MEQQQQKNRKSRNNSKNKSIIYDNINSQIETTAIGTTARTAFVTIKKYIYTDSNRSNNNNNNNHIYKNNSNTSIRSLVKTINLGAVYLNCLLSTDFLLFPFLFPLPLLILLSLSPQALPTSLRSCFRSSRLCQK